MSAFVCSDYHIATMAKYIASCNDSINAQELANKLKKINIESVNYRYDDTMRKSKCSIKKTTEITANDFAALFSCWDYQSCEGQLLDYVVMQGFLKPYAEKGNREFSNIQWAI